MDSLAYQLQIAEPPFVDEEEEAAARLKARRNNVVNKTR